MTSPYAELQLARDGDIAILTLDNPARLNPISATLQASLLRAIADVAADTSVRALHRRWRAADWPAAWR